MPVVRISKKAESQNTRQMLGANAKGSDDGLRHRSSDILLNAFIDAFEMQRIKQEVSEQYSSSQCA